MAYKYFLFSPSQLRFRKETELKMGKRFKAGWVIVNGVKTPFTELSSENKSKLYSDAKVVAYGDTTKMKYVMPGTT